MSETYTLSSVSRRAHDTESLIRWMGEQGFLSLQAACPGCDKGMDLVPDSRNKADGYSLRCRRCHTRRSVRHGSFFADHKLELWIVMQILILFNDQEDASSTARLLGVSRQAVSRIYEQCRELMAHDISMTPIKFSGADVIEADETLVSGLRGQERESGRRTQGWIFGIVSRTTGSRHLEVVPNREANTLQTIIQSHVEEGATVITDAYASYGSLHSYTHRTLNKSQVGLSYEDEELGITVHTGTIEGVWSHLRALLHVSHGWPATYIPLVLAEEMFQHDRRNFWELLKLI